MSPNRDILLINKTKHMRDTGARMLSAAGYTVHTASTMRESLAAIASKPIGLIVCGLELEDIHGADFLSYLKKDPLRDTIPFVFCFHTKDKEALHPDRVRELGATDAILYPIETDDFIHQIQKHLPRPKGKEKSPRDGPKTVPEPAYSKEAVIVPPEKNADCRPKEARVSLNGREWTECRIINHTFQGAMVETVLRGKQGRSVRMSYRMPAGPVTAVGRLIHILLGDNERPMGMGINFQGDPNWRRIHKHIKSLAEPAPGGVKAAPAAAVPSTPVLPNRAPSPEPEKRPSDLRITPDAPLGIEVSRDGVLWMYGEITEYDIHGASITTPVLGNPGEVLHIRFTLPREQKILKGRIEKVSLNNFKMSAGLEIGFSETEEWSDIFTYFSENEDSPKQLVSFQEAVPPQTPQPSEPSEKAAAKKPLKPDWTDTIVDSSYTPPAVDIKDRFYRSLIGKKLGNYELNSFLNSGSMGGVFKGWDIALERDVAVKVISYELSSRNEFVEMFFKEARLVSKLNHPNIAHIYFIGNESGIVYYAMEFIHGHTLGQLMEKHRRIQVKRAVGYLIDACRALDRVWQEKIIHRDIKPENFMISEDNVVKLLDFGVAQQQKKEAENAEANIVGSPPYLSPETIREQPVDLRSDIYSLGATFYHALSGSPPFMDDTLEGLLQQHLGTPPGALKEKLPALPSLVGDAIQKMLAKYPRERFQSYQEIIDVLTPFK